MLVFETGDKVHVKPNFFGNIFRVREFNLQIFFFCILNQDLRLGLLNGNELNLNQRLVHCF